MTITWNGRLCQPKPIFLIQIFLGGATLNRLNVDKGGEGVRKSQHLRTSYAYAHTAFMALSARARFLHYRADRDYRHDN